MTWEELTDTFQDLTRPVFDREHREGIITRVRSLEPSDSILTLLQSLQP